MKVPWVVEDDFNMVLHRQERTRDNFSSVCAVEFRILDRLNLVGLPLVRGKWTWLIRDHNWLALGLIDSLYQ